MNGVNVDKNKNCWLPTIGVMNISEYAKTSLIVQWYLGSESLRPGSFSFLPHSTWRWEHGWRGINIVLWLQSKSWATEQWRGKGNDTLIQGRGMRNEILILGRMHTSYTDLRLRAINQYWPQTEYRYTMLILDRSLGSNTLILCRSVDLYLNNLVIFDECYASC